jgi:hypothetical protein
MNKGKIMLKILCGTALSVLTVFSSIAMDNNKTTYTKKTSSRKTNRDESSGSASSEWPSLNRKNYPVKRLRLNEEVETKRKKIVTKKSYSDDSESYSDEHEKIREFIEQSEDFILEEEDVKKTKTTKKVETVEENDDFIDELKTTMYNITPMHPRAQKKSNKVNDLPIYKAFHLTNATRINNPETIKDIIFTPKRTLSKHPLAHLFFELVDNDVLSGPFANQSNWNAYEVPVACVANGVLLTKKEIITSAINFCSKHGSYIENIETKLKGLKNLSNGNNCS